MKYLFATVLFFLLTIGSSQNIETKVSPNEILAGNYVQLSYQITNLDVDFKSPDLSDFEIVSGPNVSSSIQIINGDRSSTQTYTYILRCPYEGVFTIPALDTHYENEPITTQEQAITVLPNPDGIIEDIPNQLNFFDFNIPESPFGSMDYWGG